MKIGVISSYACVKEFNNYGALLQYYALQNYLAKRGHFAYWIRSIIPHGKLRLFLRQIKNYRNLKLIYKYYQCRREFTKFIQTNLNLSVNEYSGNDDLRISCPEADFYITGSDQVWGGTLKENYLQFVKENNRKIAYSVSFGRNHIDDYQANVIRDWVKQIPYISVRENSGISICNKLIGTNRNVKHLLDPTLLIDSKDYLDFSESPNNKFLNCYFLNILDKRQIPLRDLELFAQKENLGLKISACQYSEKYFSNYGNVTPSPAEWLQNYYNAKYVITNTFHGTVFAIIFKKPFITILQNGTTSAQNERLISLLRMLGLENRLIDKIPQDLGKFIKEPIDWNMVNEIIRTKQIETDEFFTQIGL